MLSKLLVTCVPAGLTADVIQVRPEFPCGLQGSLRPQCVWRFHRGGIENVVDVPQPGLLLLQCKVRVVMLLVSLRNLE